MVNGLHLYSAFIQSAAQFMPLILPFSHQHRLAAMRGYQPACQEQLGVGCLAQGHFDTARDRTGNPPTARRQLLPLEPHRP